MRYDRVFSGEDSRSREKMGCADGKKRCRATVDHAFDGTSSEPGAIIVAGTHSGCGKTTIALGLMAALRKRGLLIQPFKAGPDFIDAGLHGLAAGRVSRNLDQWMCGGDYVADTFDRYSTGADISVIEGVMGLYDGDLNTAKLAALLGVPVVLVVDAYGAAESAAATVRGFVDTGSEDYGIRFAGVIFNRVASRRHFDRIAASVRNVPVLGCLPRDVSFEIPHRHLGLVVAGEEPISEGQLSILADTISDHIDLDRLIETAGKNGGGIEAGSVELPLAVENNSCSCGNAAKTKVAFAFDKAFCFYYEDNLDLLKKAGAEIVPFSPLVDEKIPDGVSAIYIGGGYPELYASELSRNSSILRAIGDWAKAGKPVYAECGGLMLLSRAITGIDGVRYPMAGVFSFETKMMKKPRLGYREVSLLEDCILGKSGDICRGHEFHYSEICNPDNDGCGQVLKSIYTVKDNRGQDVGRVEGFRVLNTLASYVHVHFGSNKRIAERLAAFIQGEQIL